MIRAALLLREGDGRKAIEAVAAGELYDQSADISLYPAYLRGVARLAIGDGAAAAQEFQKILHFRGIVLYEIIGALAHLGLGRRGSSRAIRQGPESPTRTFSLCGNMRIRKFLC